MSNQNSHFIAADESKWIIRFFDIYTRFLFRLRFHRVWIDLRYKPSSSDKTIYFLNHTSWWDGIIPLLLNQIFFQQNARAMMEDKQMVRYPFFRKIGAFSVNTENPRSAVQSLRYARLSLQRPNSSLFIYPEGEIVPFTVFKPHFKRGIGWLAKNCPDTDLVPIGIYIHTAKHSKPELHIRAGFPVNCNRNSPSEELTDCMESSLQVLLKDLVHDAHHDRSKFKAL